MTADPPAVPMPPAVSMPSAGPMPFPPALPDRDLLHAVLEHTERRLDPANPEAGGHVKVLAYGEISAAITTDELPGLVCKRMAGFPDGASVSAYLDLVDEYLGELATAGISVAPTTAVPIRRNGRPPIVYLVQPRMDPETLGHRMLHTCDVLGLAAAIGQVLDSVALLAQHSDRRTDGIEVALDGQLSNWSFSADTSPRAAVPVPPVLIDVGTPFIRRDGRHSLDARVILAPAPPGLRALLLRFVADSYQDDYFVPRTVALDLLGNFHKEGAADRIGTGLEVVNQWLATTDIPGPRDPIQATEVTDYYRRDAQLLGLFLQARRADRAVRTKLLRRDYDFLLPGTVAR